jgi:hypothetical protein
VRGSLATMDIHFISTLTPEDEDRYAPMVISAVQAILNFMPISYAVRITTANHRVFHHTKAEPDLTTAVPPDRIAGYASRRSSLS